MVHRRALDGIVAPQEWRVLLVDPGGSHIDVVRMERVPRLSGGVNEEGPVPVRQVLDHSHGGARCDGVALAETPVGGIDDRSAASAGEAAAIEKGLNRGDAGFAEGLVAKGRQMEPAPGPGRRIVAGEPDDL